MSGKQKKAESKLEKTDSDDLDESQDQNEEISSQPRFGPKSLFYAPDQNQYYVDQRGFIRRKDLRGMTRKEAKAIQKQKRKERIKKLKAKSGR